MADEKNFWQKVLVKIEPIVAHSLCLLALALALLFLAGILYILEQLLPDKKEFISMIKTIDLWVIFFLVCAFGLYTLIKIVVILFKDIRDEWKK